MGVSRDSRRSGDRGYPRETLQASCEILHGRYLPREVCVSVGLRIHRGGVVKKTSDLDILNNARNGVLYGGVRNSLVEWTLSEEWTTPMKGRSQDPVSGVIVTSEGKSGCAQWHWFELGGES